MNHLQLPLKQPQQQQQQPLLPPQQHAANMDSEPKQDYNQVE